MQSLVLNSLLVAPLLLALSCGSSDGGGEDPTSSSCSEDTRDEEYVAGIQKVGDNGYKVSIVDALPSPPARHDNTWTVEIRGPGDELVDAMELVSTPFMPDHGHGTPLSAATSALGEGRYELKPVNLFMPGYWEIELDVVDPGPSASGDDDSVLDSVMFRFCVDP